MNDFRKPKTARELAARALCRFHGLSADAITQGQPLWCNFLAEVDIVLDATTLQDYTMAEWQPIETAPKDGRGILLYVPDNDLADESNIWLAYWEDDKWKGYPESDLEPTNWMSLPPPPNKR